MTLDIASQVHPDVSAFDQIMAEEQRFGEPLGKHLVEDKSLIDECVTGQRRGRRRRGAGRHEGQ
jgi:hypothetical protein